MRLENLKPPAIDSIPFYKRLFSPPACRLWLVYAFTVAVTGAALVARWGMGIAFGDRPWLILLLLPITFSAYVGGLGPGLLSTALTASFAKLFLFPPFHSLVFAQTHDLAQWLLFVGEGFVITTLLEALHRSRRRLEILIEESKHSANVLLENQTLLQQAIQVAKLGVFHHDHGHDLVRLSAQMREICGKRADEAIGLPEWIELIHPDDRDLVAATVERAHAPDSDGHYAVEHRLLLPGGRIRWVAVRSQTFFGDVGGVQRPILTVGAVLDITERKEAEAALLRFNTELERQVVERTAEIQAANREMESFAYTVSHDLRAPLRHLMAFSQILAQQSGDCLTKDGRDCLDHIVQASARMNELIDGLLQLCRITQGEMQHRLVDLSALAERLLAEFASAEPQRQVAWQVEPGLTVRGDGRMLEALLANLLGNAWKYTARVPSPYIRMYQDKESNEQWLCVADNGAGFDMARASRLFKPFQRLHQPDEFPGLGIGLATVQRIVHRHGGVIHARAEPGKGATFYFSLPEANQPKENDAEDFMSPADHG